MEKDKKDNPAREPPVRLAFRLSYLGSRFFGSQQQAASRTVEGEFIAACKRLSLFDDWREAGFLSAGRTDRGVHARGQIIAFSTDYPSRALETINLQLPPDLWCTAYSVVPEGFHPRYDAISRTYRYFFSEIPQEFAEMSSACNLFLGTHDFSRFARVRDKNPLRTILGIRVAKEDDYAFLEVKASSFLWHQVRCMVTALLRIGGGEMGKESILRLLQDGSDHPLPPAPAEGLILWDTDCGVDWTLMDEGERSSEFMHHLHSHHALMKKICLVLKQD